VGVALASAVSAAEVAEILVEAAVDALDAKAGGLGLVEPGGKEMRLLGARGLDPQVLAIWRSFPLEAPFPVAIAARRGESIWVEDVESALQWARPAKLARAAAMGCVPLRGPSGPMGALAVFFDAPHRFQADERAFLVALARIGRAAVERARTHEAERAGRQAAEDALSRLRQVQHATAALGRAASLPEVAGIVAHEALDAMEAAACVALVLPGGHEVGSILGEAGEDPELEQTRRALLDHHAPEVLETGVPRWPRSTPRSHGEAHRGQGVGFASVPFMLDGKAVGALGVRLLRSSTFGEEERLFLTALADLCSQAIERARIYEAECAERARAEAAAREAAEANRLKDELLGMVSHELRTPLTAILGWTRMLRTGATRPEQVERALETIERNALLQTRLVEDLLDTARILRGKLVLERGPVDLRGAVERALEGLSLAAASREITLRLAADPAAAAELWADGARIDQVVGNLLGNAMKFTPPGGTIEVRLAPAPAPGGDRVRLEVRDTGEGIPADLLPHIFEPFRQADTSATRKHGGLGLGLSIVRHLVEAHGGTISAESAGPGRGATFTVELPVVPSPLQSPGSAAPPGIADA